MKNGLNEFIDLLEQEGLLLRVKEFVDTDFEIAEITDRICHQFNGMKAILFENTGSPIPVLTYMPGYIEEIYQQLGLIDFKKSKARLHNFLYSRNRIRKSFFEELFRNRSFNRLSKYEPFLWAGKGDCQQVVHLDPDLTLIPILSNWPKEGGKCILNAMAHTKNPDNGETAIDFSVLQFFSKNITSIDFQSDSVALRNFDVFKKKGLQMPVVITLGNDPSYTFPLRFPFAYINQLHIMAGLIRGRAIKLVKGITTDIDLPSDAEIVIEGYIDPQEELIWHGPHATAWGQYSNPKWVHKFFVTCISHRFNAVYPSAINNVPIYRDRQKKSFTEQILLEELKNFLLPEIIDIHLPFQQISWGIAIVKMKKSYVGQTNKIANLLWGLDAFKSIKILIVVDDELDIRDLEQVSKFVSEHYDPIYDTYIGSGPCNSDTISSVREGVEGKLLIDATKKQLEERAPNKKSEFDMEGVAEILSDKEILIDSYSARLMALGVSLLIVGFNSKSANVRTSAAKILRKLNGSEPKVIVFVDNYIRVEDASVVAWNLLSNIDPARDCFFIDLDDVKISSLIIDATSKHLVSEKVSHINPSIVISGRETIDKVDKKWNDLGLGEMISSPSLMFYKE